LEYLNKDSTIFLAGHKGMVGSAILKKFKKSGYRNILTVSKKDLDLTDQKEVKDFFSNNNFSHLIIAAAKVGGINANDNFKADFLYENLMIESNLIHQSFKKGIKSLIFLGSSCIYPRLSRQPIKEDYLLSGELEKTNEGYSLAKISGLKLCETYNAQYGTDFRCLMPTNLYGPNDNFNAVNSHVIPSLINKFHQAKKNNLSEVEIWGTGSPMREFMHVDDLADACLFFMEKDKNQIKKICREFGSRNSFFNVGTGKDISIKDLAFLMKEIFSFKGEIIFNKSMPDGTPQKLLDVSLMKTLGWTSKISLKEGLIDTYSWYENNLENLRV
jgi:GDP-L-fucose synthase